MLKIGLFIQDLISEYSNCIIQGVKKYCLQNNIQLFIYIVRAKDLMGSDYEYQYHASRSLATKDNIDGIFLVTNTYCKYIPNEKQFDAVKELNYVPLVSFGVEIPGISSVSGVVESAFMELLEHLEKDHGCKKIYFLGPESKAYDIVVRFDIYKKFMESRNQTWEDKIIYADYISEHAKGALEDRKITKENLPFDALVCCTDDLAFGCLDYFKEHNIKVPEDLIVTGFDNQKRCDFNKPNLSSVDMCFTEQCFEAAKILHEEILNPDLPKRQLRLDAKFIKRHSCGCGHSESSLGFVEGQYFQLREQVYSFQYFLQDLQVTDETDKIKSIIIDYYKKFGVQSCVCCVYEHPKVLQSKEEFILPEKASVFFAYNENKIFEYGEDFYLNPSKKMYPGDFEFEQGREIVISALFDHEYQYGYILYTPGDLDYNTYEMITTMTGITLARNLVFSEKVHETEKLSTEKKHLETTTYFDEMTGALNRRGLYKYALPAMKSSIERGLTGSVIFGDMDHLKLINDNYGHEAGDRAIKGEVEILKSVFRPQDVIARLGGDEFLIVACGLKACTYGKVRERLEEVSRKYNEEHKEPFTISISLGFVEFNDYNGDLDVLMKKADEEQYKEKVLHHKNRV